MKQKICHCDAICQDLCGMPPKSSFVLKENMIIEAIVNCNPMLGIVSLDFIMSLPKIDGFNAIYIKVHCLSKISYGLQGPPNL